MIQTTFINEKQHGGAEALDEANGKLSTPSSVQWRKQTISQTIVKDGLCEYQNSSHAVMYQGFYIVSPNLHTRNKR